MYCYPELADIEKPKMKYFTLARVVHVIAIILWIGGVSMVTTVLIPAIKKMKSKEEQIKTFETIEGKFSIQAKVTTEIMHRHNWVLLIISLITTAGAVAGSHGWFWIK